MSDNELRSRIQRFAALRNAWRALSSSAFSGSRQAVLERAKELGARLTALRADPMSGGPAPDLSEVDLQLAALAEAMDRVVDEISMAQLRSTLPGTVERSRREALDLLDLILENDEAIEARVPLLDYLITLLSTEQAGPHRGVHSDPATLTPFLTNLCQNIESKAGSDLAELEALLYAAASLDETDAAFEETLHDLRARKGRLGRGFLSPRVLRAAVTYNAAMWNRVESRRDLDWVLPVADEVLPTAATLGNSDARAFESAALKLIHDALRRRLAGDSPRLEDCDRIAWCLDLAYLEDTETEQVRHEPAEDEENPIGTTILLGLLCRASQVIANELAEIGITEKQLQDRWLKELDQQLKSKITAELAEQRFERACVLSELKNKFLYAPMSEAYQRAREAGIVERHTSDETELGGMRRDLRKSLAGVRAESIEAPVASNKTSTLRQVSRWVAAGLLVGLSAVNFVEPGPKDIEEYDRRDLKSVSPFLSSGYRNRKGAGPLFVGTIDPEWATLEPDDRWRVTSELVAALREQGAKEIMIFDPNRRLQIQFAGGTLAQPRPPVTAKRRRN